jgi:flavin reductase (DIM6/NTAB) family NADH-FMN oxidoreductase RutF
VERRALAWVMRLRCNWPRCSRTQTRVVLRHNTVRFGERFIHQSGCFAVNVLATQQRSLALRFAGKDWQGKIFSDIPHYRGARLRDVALFDEALTGLECRVIGVYPGGDHVLLLGQVMAIECSPEVQTSGPLLFYRSAFRTLGRETMELGAWQRTHSFASGDANRWSASTDGTN